MTANIYDSANQIEREIRQMDEFVALKEAFDAMKKEEEFKCDRLKKYVR